MEFNILTEDWLKIFPDATDGFCPRVVEAAEYGPEVIVGGDQKVTDRNIIVIHFEYPLNRPTSFEFQSPEGEGFTYYDFWRHVYAGYKAIYADDKLMGSYGIWGHDIGDLFLEAFTEFRPGEYRLHMGS